MKRILVLMLGAMLVGLTGCGTGTGEAVSPATESKGAEALNLSAADDGTLTVSGSAEVSIIPDMAEVSFGVLTTEKTAETAQQRNNEDMEAVLSMLESLGVAEKSIRTTDYSLYPRYDDYGETVISYTASTTLTVSDIPIDDVGRLLTKCTESGINDINDIRYFSSEYDASYEAALTEAVAAAKTKASVLAEASGGKLGDVYEITEGYQDTSYRYSYDNGVIKYATAATEEAASYDVAVMPGEVTVSAQVTVTFLLE